jgi:hypothetical protein
MFVFYKFLYSVFIYNIMINIPCCVTKVFKLCPLNPMYNKFYCNIFLDMSIIICNDLEQRFPNFFQVGTTFISQNVLQTTLLLSSLKANCLRFSATACDTQFRLIWFFMSFFGLMFNLRGPQGQNPRTTCGPQVVRGPQFGKRWSRGCK